MFSRALLLFLPVATFGALSGGYNYDRCNMTYGTSDWPGFCQNQMSGTPINLCGAVAFTGTAPTISVQNYAQSRSMTLNNDGTSLKVAILSTDTAVPTLQAGTLAKIVGQSSNQTAQTWTLAQMHLHWGRYNKTNEGSEHYMQGQAYAAEAHFVHYNSQYSNLNAAVASGATDALLVVGVFLKYGTTDDSATITTMAQGAKTATVAGASVSVTLSDLFDGTGTFYSYGGSLTTPTCNPVVTWIVMTTPKSVSWSTLMNIWQAPLYPSASGRKFATQAASDWISALGNYRPLQQLNGRTVYNSGGTTAACTTVSQPDFMCSAGITTTSGAMSYITSKYAQTSFIFSGVTSMSATDRATMASAITNNEIIQVTGAVYAYLLCTGQPTMPLASSSQSAVTSIAITSWGTTSTKAAYMSYASNATGLTSMNIPYDPTYSYILLFSVDRMNDAGTLTNSEPMTFTVTGSGITSGLQVMTYNSDSPGGVDITTQGGSVTNQGSDNWLISLTHTSAVAARVATTTTSNSQSTPPASSPAPFKPSVYEHNGLFGLLALLVLPVAAVVVCFWGWKQVPKKAKAGADEPMYETTAPKDTYPYGLPTSPPAISMPYPQALPPAYPTVAYPLMP